jgi:hypothetical protein
MGSFQNSTEAIIHKKLLGKKLMQAMLGLLVFFIAQLIFEALIANKSGGIAASANFLIAFFYVRYKIQKGVKQESYFLYSLAIAGIVFFIQSCFEANCLCNMSFSKKETQIQLLIIVFVAMILILILYGVFNNKLEGPKEIHNNWLHKLIERLN